MVVHTRAVPQGHSRICETLTDCNSRENWPAVAGGLDCRCEVDRYGLDIFVQIAFSAVVIQECARCLERFDLPVRGNTAVTIHHGAERGGRDEGSGTDFFYDEGNEDVDLSPAIFDELMLALPLKPLCSDECRGIRAGGAQKQEEPTDPRWDALRKLKNSRQPSTDTCQS